MESGDVIGVHRLHDTMLIPYIHYAVYIGSGKIIHYSEDKVKEADMGSFFIGSPSRSYFLIDFEKLNRILNDYTSAPLRLEHYPNPLKFSRGPYKLYSAEETINRARSKIGEKKYNSVFNNCEHFAMWCKTGESESNQTADMLKLSNPERVYLTY